MSTSFPNFGAFLQQKRIDRNITLRKLAELLGFSAPFLSDVEKDRRNPPELSKLQQIAQILCLSPEENEEMLNLAGKKRDSVAPDLPEYIMQHDYVAAALRTARDLDAGEEEWLRFVDELKQRKG